MLGIEPWVFWVAMAAYVLRRPWRIPKLIRLGQGSNRAIRASTDAVLKALDAPR